MSKTPKKRLNQSAYEAGVAARLRGDPCAPPKMMAKTLESEWEKGWIEAVPVRQVDEPPLPVPPEEPKTHFLQPGQKLPEEYDRTRSYLPCPHCKRRQLPDGGQAVLLSHTGNGKAYLRCRSRDCGRGHTLPLKGAK